MAFAPFASVVFRRGYAQWITFLIAVVLVAMPWDTRTWLLWPLSVRSFWTSVMPKPGVAQKKLELVFCPVHFLIECPLRAVLCRFQHVFFLVNLSSCACVHLRRASVQRLKSQKRAVFIVHFVKARLQLWNSRHLHLSAQDTHARSRPFVKLARVQRFQLGIPTHHRATPIKCHLRHLLVRLTQTVHRGLQQHVEIVTTNCGSTTCVNHSSP